MSYTKLCIDMEDITIGYTQEQWEKVKKESPNLYKEIPIDVISIVCESCQTRFCLKDIDGIACKNCGMRWDKQSTW